MPRYISFEDVRIRLVGKVRFTDDPSEENEMSNKLALRLINEAEGQVELDLSPRYFSPFQTAEGAEFKNLPDRPTKETLRSLCELRAIMNILDIDFGRGTIVNASNYYNGIEKRYNSIVGNLLKRRDEYGSGWYLPPLPGLRLNYQNAAADDGFAGQVLVAGSENLGTSYPQTRINDPSQSFWQGTYDDGQY
jgi:hypothetical protein